MAEFLAIALAFPSVVYTVLLGVALVYWVFVMIGAARLNLLGDGAADGALDGAADAGLDGVAKGALEGAAKGALEGVADHLEAPDLHHAGGDGADGGDVGDAGDGHGGLAGMLASLHLRSAPATVVLSSLLLFSWFFSVVGMQAATALFNPTGVGIARFVVFLLAPILALPVTSIAIRPLARIFVVTQATKKDSLVGKVCVIRTGTVTDRFGEAMLEDGGAGLVVRVRVDAGEKLGRGDQALIVGYDEESQEFTVAPMDEEIAARGPQGRSRAH